MIPQNFIEKWRPHAEWQTQDMVEQDLIISRALVCLYNNPSIKEKLVFRGGTALHKIFIKPAARYSEDIDFVQLHPEPIGPLINAIRDCLKPWLGDPKRKITQRSAKLLYPYTATSSYSSKLKIEINTTEHFQVLPLRYEPLTIDSEWFKGSTTLVTYELEELIATKLRALYQRRKGRDLFDIWHIFNYHLLDAKHVIEIFKKYCDKEGTPISQESFEKNLNQKRLHKDFQVDINPLLSPHTHWNFDEAFDFVVTHLISNIT